jgi:hypothetical protein
LHFKSVRNLVSCGVSIAACVLAGSHALGESVSYVGADLSTSGSWRTSSVLKPLDIDGNNVYGTDGYLLTGSSDLLVNPAYATVTRVSSNTYPGNGGYTSVDNPQGPGTRVTGVWYTSSAQNSVDDLVRITITAATSFRVGVLTDNADFADISPDLLRIRQTTGGTADSGLINSYLSPNRSTDWYFFDITGAKSGDTFVISGQNVYGGSGAQGSNGIGGITFDSSTTTPEPGSIALLVAGGMTGAAFFHRKKVRKSA